MRKFISILLVLLLVVSFTACSIKTNNQQEKSLKIETALLTEDESNLFKLMGVDNNSQIFDYTVDGNVKSCHINIYILDENLKWEECGGSAWPVENLNGRIAISGMENQKIRIAYQDENAGNAWTSNLDVFNLPFEDATGKASTISWKETSDIVYEQEIPLAIQILTSSNEVSTYGLESFYDTQKLKGHDIVIAVTITFSQTVLQ